MVKDIMLREGLVVLIDENEKALLELVQYLCEPLVHSAIRLLHVTLTEAAFQAPFKIQTWLIKLVASLSHDHHVLELPFELVFLF